MAEIKVLALDLDGTLTNDQKEVTPRTRAALDAAIERGVAGQKGRLHPVLQRRQDRGLPHRRNAGGKNVGPRAGPGAVRLCRRAGCGHPDLQQ